MICMKENPILDTKKRFKLYKNRTKVIEQKNKIKNKIEQVLKNIDIFRFKNFSTSLITKINIANVFFSDKINLT